MPQRFVNRTYSILMVLCAILLSGWHAADDDRDTAISKAPAVAGVLIIKFKTAIPGKAAVSGMASFDELAQKIQTTGLRQLFPAAVSGAGKLGMSAEQAFSLQRIYELQFDRDTPVHIAAALLSSDPNVEYAEPRYLYQITGFTDKVPASETALHIAVPDDPQFLEMSHLTQVHLPEAWDVVKSGDGSVIISVVDAGIDWEHEDLVTNIWRNPGEIDGNGIDDDGNGFVDDIRGWNFANDSNDPKGLEQTPANGEHGTIVAGVAAAVTDNGAGIAGASWNARLMPVNVGCADSDGAVCFGYEGVVYAAMKGADVINVSWGGPDSFFGRDAVKAALDLGALLVVSAGNGTGVSPEGINIDKNLLYPAAYERVLVVGSTEKNNDAKADFSNFGVGVDVFAPGVSLNSTTPGNSYTSQANGTSFSTPLVAGLAALLKTRYPLWTLDQVREQIRVTSDAIDGANMIDFQRLLGKGRINAGRALQDTTSPSLRISAVEITDSGRDGNIQNGESITVGVDLVNHLADAQNLTLSLSIDDPGVIIQRSSFSLPDMASGGSTTVQFSFSFANNVPNDHGMNFRVDIQGKGAGDEGVEGAAYADSEIIRLIANRATHNTGVLQMSLTDDGNIGWSGFQDESEGQGFKYLDVDWLFEGGVLIGTGPDKISDSIRNTGDNTQDEDFSRPEDGFFGILGSSVLQEDGSIIVAENGLVILDDQQAPDPLGIKVHQESYADSREEHNDFIILRYVVSHADPDATISLENLYIGLFTDWDLTRTGDYARFDARRRMGIVQPSDTEPVLLLATKLLSNMVGLSYRSIDNEEIFDSRSGGDGFTNAEKWSFMTEGVQVERVDETDVSTLLTAGPFRLIPGEKVEATFALLAARTETELEGSADRAQTFWNNTLARVPPFPVNAEEEAISDDYSLDPAFPNPAIARTTIGFTLPTPGVVDIIVYDVLGRKIAVLVNETRSRGRHAVQWDGRNHNGELVSNGVYFYQMNVSSAQRNYTSTRRFVFVH